MRQYCSDTVRMITPLDTSLVTSAVMTLQQANIQENIEEFEFPGDGVFVARLTGEQMSRFKPGFADLQLRGFVDGEEFSTDVVSVLIAPVLLKEVLTDD